MPVWLRFVISGILAGGILGFRIVLCCFPHPPVWPFLFSFSCLFCFVFDGHTRRWHTRCHRAHTRQELVAVPLFPGLLFVPCFLAAFALFVSFSLV